MAVQRPTTKTLNDLREILLEWFDESDLADLCFGLSVRYHHIKGDSTADKARELISYMLNRGRFAELVEACANARPHIETLQVMLSAQSEAATPTTPAPPTADAPATPPSLSPSSSPVLTSAVTLVLRLIPQSSTTAQIIWESDVIGRRRSLLKLPVAETVLPVVIKALDAVQYPGHRDHAAHFSPEEQHQLAALGLWQHGTVVYDIHSTFGALLYQSLVEDMEGNIALNTVRDHATRIGASITYMLRFPPDGVLFAALPWELLRDTHNFLLIERGKIASCIRHLDFHQALPMTPPVYGRRRMLALVPQAGIPESIRQAEQTARMATLSPLIQSDMIEMAEVQPVTLPKLVDWIQTHPPIDYLYFYGHGRYTDQHGELLLDTDYGNQEWVSCERLAALFGNIRLVIICACQSAMVSDGGLRTGIAAALIAAGVPAVAAMQFTVRVSAATRFAEIICRNLVQDADLSAAISQARQALYVEEDAGVSWWVPTLTVRSRNP